MSAHIGPRKLAAAGTTGNNNHTSVGVDAVSDCVAVEFVVEAVGGTPTVTFKLQGSFDDPAVVNDASANWYDIILLPSDSDTAAVSKTVTATGAYVSFLGQAHVRYAKRVRLSSSANTNVTYRANLHEIVR